MIEKLNKKWPSTLELTNKLNEIINEHNELKEELMPNIIRKRGGKWCVVEKSTGTVKSRHTTKGKAQASSAARAGHILPKMKRKK